MVTISSFLREGSALSSELWAAFIFFVLPHSLELIFLASALIPRPVLVLTGKKINIVGDKAEREYWLSNRSLCQSLAPSGSLPFRMVISCMGIFTVTSPRSNFTKE